MNWIYVHKNTFTPTDLKSSHLLSIYCSIQRQIFNYFPFPVSNKQTFFILTQSLIRHLVSNVRSTPSVLSFLSLFSLLYWSDYLKRQSDSPPTNPLCILHSWSFWHKKEQRHAVNLDIPLTGVLAKHSTGVLQKHGAVMGSVSSWPLCSPFIQ